MDRDPVDVWLDAAAVADNHRRWSSAGDAFESLNIISLFGLVLLLASLFFIPFPPLALWLYVLLYFVVVNVLSSVCNKHYVNHKRTDVKGNVPEYFKMLDHLNKGM